MTALDKQVGGDHYKELIIQPVEYIHANNIPFIEGSVIKYVSRWRNKNGIVDLEKAKHFIELLILLETDSKN
jgi:UDP-3-O-acyl-N-acetylglucosamine deacetylase